MKKSIFLTLILSFCLNSFSQDAEDFFKKATELRDKRENNKALVEINKALQLQPRNTSYLNEKAAILTVLRNYQAAYDLYTESLLIDSLNFLTYNDRGLLLYEIQEFDAAINDLTRGIKIARNDSDRNVLLVNRGAAKIYKRDFNGAYEDLITVYKNDSSDLGMLTNLATICDEVGRGEETLQYLARALKIDPDNIAANGNMGFKYQEMGDYRTAINYYNRVLELNPGDPLGYSNRSFSRLKLKDLKGARSDIEISLEIFPDNSYAYRIRALIFIEEKKFDQACADLDKAIDLNFTNMYGDEVLKLKEKHCPK